jgi:hypothetical protein
MVIFYMNTLFHDHLYRISFPLIFIFIVSALLFAQTGRLTVTSQPSGVMLWLDDAEIGITPLYDRTVGEGFHVLRLVDPSSNTTTTQTVQILADSSVSLNVVLGNSTTGYLNVESKPQGANVTLVTVLGKTPLHAVPVNPGAYSVRIESPKPYYSCTVREAAIIENNTETITVSLLKNKPYIYKTTAKILLGLASIGCYALGFRAESDDQDVLSGAGFAVGTACLIGVEIISFF